ncbi:hypothetical protein TO66_18220 [Pseudomonas sp. MRSN 12121]|nr:hypothetical protein TO66_18220 [Pseudomonas sp. MRSN 12121]
MQEFYPSPHGTHVAAEDFEHVKAERDALQQRLNDRDQRVDELEQERDSLRDQLAAWQALAAERLELMAERDALMNRAVQAWAAADNIKDMHAAMAALRDALSASAEHMCSFCQGRLSVSADHMNMRPCPKCSAEPSTPEYPRVQMVKAHSYTCASVKDGDAFGLCDCGAVVDGVAVEVKTAVDYAEPGTEIRTVGAKP